MMAHTHLNMITALEKFHVTINGTPMRGSPFSLITRHDISSDYHQDSHIIIVC